MPHPTIGTIAPAFSLQDQHGNTVQLQDLRGRKVLVYFYPKAMTPGCTVQACVLRDVQAELAQLNTVVLAISPDPVARLKKFAERDALGFTLLSDADHAVAERYGAWGLKKFMGREYMGILRSSFLIDEQGRVLHVMDKVTTKTHHQDVLALLKAGL